MKPTSRQLHVARCREVALEVIMNRKDDDPTRELGPDELTLEQAQGVLDRISTASTIHCVCCGYKQKTATGAVEEKTVLDNLDSIALNFQRDGDSGDIGIRLSHHHMIVEALWNAPEGLTDDEIVKMTGIISKSSAACRSALMIGGWVRASKRPKRLSLMNQEMTVWELTPLAETTLFEELLSRETVS